MATTDAPEGEDIDTDALQSQIDMSMSLIHDLVSSWVKPSQHVRTNSAAKELEEYMRRPPRLGVGAPIPEASNAYRDAARLKNQLTNGKKRARQEKEVISQRCTSSDDEEESRASMMKKKVKVDVFEVGKKKGKKLHGLLTPQSTPSSSQTRKLQDKESSNTEIGINREDSQDHNVTSHGHSAAKAVVNSSTTRNDALTTASPGTLYSPPRVRTFQTIPGLVIQPLLNLDGPPPDAIDPANATIPPQGLSPKKKRKRRKKKKASMSNIPIETGSI